MQLFMSHGPHHIPHGGPHPKPCECWPGDRSLQERAVFAAGRLPSANLTGSTCLLKPRGAHDTVRRTLLCQVLQRLGVHGLRLAAVRFLSMRLPCSHIQG